MPYQEQKHKVFNELECLCEGKVKKAHDYWASRHTEQALKRGGNKKVRGMCIFVSDLALIVCGILSGHTLRIAPCILRIQAIHGHIRSLASMPSRYTTHMDVGNADFAWSKNQPFVLNIKNAPEGA